PGEAIAVAHPRGGRLEQRLAAVEADQRLEPVHPRERPQPGSRSAAEDDGRDARAGGIVHVPHLGTARIRRNGRDRRLYPSADSRSTASTSWPTVSISACMFIVMRMSNSSSTEATKSITTRLSHSRSPWKVVASLRATPFLLKGSISRATVSMVCWRSLTAVPFNDAPGAALPCKCGGN